MEVLSSRVLIHPRDPERSRRFYGQQLGLAIYREFPGGTVYFLGGGFLELVGRADQDREPGSGTALWLQVRDLAAAVAVLSERGVAIDREPRREPWGLDEASISDPDGRRIVLVEVPAEHPLRVDTR